MSDPFVIHDPVVASSDGFHLRHPDGTVKLLNGGRPFISGWRPIFLFVGFDPIHILEFEHDSGERASWFVKDGERLGGHALELSEVEKSLLLDVSSTLFAGSANGRALGPGFNQLNEACRKGVEALHQAARDKVAVTALSQYDMALTFGAHELRSVVHADATNRSDPHGRLVTIGDVFEPDRGWRLKPEMSSFRFRNLTPVKAYFLRLDFGPIAAAYGVVVSAEFSISIDDEPLATTKISIWQKEGAYLGYWLPPQYAELSEFTIKVCCSWSPAVEQRFLYLDAISLLSIPIDAAAPHRTEKPIKELLSAFENLGDNCEFGAMQRKFGYEPLGLFRFAGVLNIRNTIRLLDDGLEYLGAPGSLRYEIEYGEYIIRDDRYGLHFHTLTHVGEVEEASVLPANEKKLQYLRRRFLEDLEDGEKIWVYKRSVTRDAAEMFALHAALNRYGKNKLLWVTDMREDQIPGNVEWIGVNLLKGYLDRIALGDINDFRPEVWLRLCRNALHAFQEAEGA